MLGFKSESLQQTLLGMPVIKILALFWKAYGNLVRWDRAVRSRYPGENFFYSYLCTGVS